MNRLQRYRELMRTLDPSGGERQLALLETRRVLDYGNGRFVVHPTLAPLLDLGPQGDRKPRLKGSEASRPDRRVSPRP